MKLNRKIAIYSRKAKFSSILLLGLSIAGVYSYAHAGESKGVKKENVEIGEIDKMTPSEMLAWVQQQTGISKQILEKVQRMLENSRKEKDTIKITCLDDKVTQIQVSYRGVEERSESLKLSIDTKDTVSAKQILSILKIYFTRIMGLNSEAENCLGESDVVLGKTESTVFISGDVTGADPSSEDISNDFGVDQPAQISAYM